MIEVTFRIESLDYTDKLDSQLPLVLEALSQSGNINPVLKLACNTPEASSRIVKGWIICDSKSTKLLFRIRLLPVFYIFALFKKWMDGGCLDSRTAS